MIPVLQHRLGLKEKLKEVIPIESNIDLKGLEHLPIFYEVIINEQVLEIDYQDFKSEESFTPSFNPYYLKRYNNRWFAFGLNEELDIPTWNLALDRIVSISQTQKKYLANDIEWKDYFYDIVGVTKPLVKIRGQKLLPSVLKIPFYKKIQIFCQICLYS